MKLCLQIFGSLVLINSGSRTERWQECIAVNRISNLLSTQFSAKLGLLNEHLLNIPSCAKNYLDSRFEILSRAINSYHLLVLKPQFIRTREPKNYKQQDFYNLKLFIQRVLVLFLLFLETYYKVQLKVKYFYYLKWFCFKNFVLK